MTQKCTKCGETKEIKKFRYIRGRRKYSTVCRDCETLGGNELKAKYRREYLIVKLQECWAELCRDMNKSELDQRLFSLKEIYKKVQQDLENE